MTTIEASLLDVVTGGDACSDARAAFHHHTRRFLGSAGTMQTANPAERRILDNLHNINVSQLSLWADRVSQACGYATK